MKLLLIEDDQKELDSLSKHLGNIGYTIDTCTNGKTGSYLARTNTYDLILIDYFLPGMNGEAVCNEIRLAKINTPIIFVSENKTTTDKVKAFELGADDFIQKPYIWSELSARIKAVTRRPYKIQDEIFTLDDLTINTSTQDVFLSGERIYLTRKEYSLLECMARKPGVIVTRGEILETAWNNDSNPFSNTIEAHVRNLRKKIGESKNKKYIHTISGRGYKLDRLK